MTRVAYQGEPGANSEIATIAYFGENVEPVPCPGFIEMFDAVTSGNAAFAVVPIENSLAGSVIDNYDLLINRPVFITGELFMHVRHQLLALPGVALEEIRRVYSHPQALAQSADFLRAHRAMQPEPAFDTAGAARLVSEGGQRDSAALATRRAGRLYGLDILAPDVQSNSENYTRMVIISLAEQEPPPDANVKTSVIAGLRHERGSLAKLLGVLDAAGMNLTKIESRPIVGRPWEYLFYLDWEGRLDQEAQDLARESTTWWKYLGAYSRGKKFAED